MDTEKYFFINLKETRSMKQAQSFLPVRPAGISWMALVLLCMLALQPSFTMAAQPGFESLPVLSASKILPPELLSGPNHRVQEKVKNDGIVNIYTIDSRFGTFSDGGHGPAQGYERIRRFLERIRTGRFGGGQRHGLSAR